MDFIKGADFFQESFPLAVRYVTDLPSCPLHTHDFSELVVVQRGGGIQRVEAQEHQIRAGDIFVMQGTMAHAFRDCTAFNHINILFRLDQLPIALDVLHDLPGFHALFSLEPQASAHSPMTHRLHLQATTHAWLLQRVAELHSELTQQPPGYQAVAAALFLQIVIQLSRAYESEHGGASHQLLQVGKILRYLRQHVAEPITLDQLAEAVQLSKRSLLRHFTGSLGVPPIEYLLRLRVEKAMSLLSETDYAITDIATRVGFHDSNYFARQFHRLVGMSPRAYRQQAQSTEVTLLPVHEAVSRYE